MEQNSDRMLWAVIALVIGAALLAILKVAFPEVLTSITDYFKSLIPSIPAP